MTSDIRLRWLRQFEGERFQRRLDVIMVSMTYCRMNPFMRVDGRVRPKSERRF
jgi:hypothetical protein